MSDAKINPTGWILYDDSCGFCRRWIPFWENTLRKRGFETAPLQADWVRKKLKLTENELMQDLRLLLANGQQIRGADTYRYAMKRIWWAYPIYLFAIAPIGRSIFDWGYRTFAAHRYQVSRLCRLRLFAGVGLVCLAQLASAGPMPLKSEPGTENISTNFSVAKISENAFGIGELRFDKQKRSITFPASVNMTNGAIEYLLVSAHGKLHESVLKTDVEPMQLHMAKLLLEPKSAGTNSSQRRGDAEKNSTSETNGDRVTISLNWKIGKHEQSCRAEDLILNSETKSSMTRGDWVYNGSRIVNGQFAAQHERSIISIIADPDSLVNNPRRGREKDGIWQVNPTNTPPLNTPVQITIQFQNTKTK